MTLIAAFAAAGCSSYQLRGKVVEGSVSQILIVDQDDPRLDQPGLANATVEVTVDPQTLARKPLPAQTTAGDGSFAVPIDEIGAGTLEYQAGLIIQRRQYQTAHEILAVPSGGKRVLVTLARGADRFVRPEDPLGDSRRFLPPE